MPRGGSAARTVARAAKAKQEQEQTRSPSPRRLSESFLSAVADVADLAQSDEQRMQGMHEFVGSDGNTHVFARRATVFCLSEKNPVRVGCVKLITHPAFDGVILFLIIYSSALMAITDYGHFYKEGESGGDVGEPKADGSFANTLSYVRRARARRT